MQKQTMPGQPLAEDPVAAALANGDQQWQQGRLFDAIACYETACRTAVGMADAWARLGLAWLYIGRVDRGRSCLARALHCAPRRLELLSAWIHASRHDPHLSSSALRAIALQCRQHRHGQPGGVLSSPPLDQPLRIGLVVAGLHLRPVVARLAVLLPALTRHGAMLQIYHAGPEDCAARDSLRQHTVCWLDTATLSTAQLCDRIAADNLHALIDMIGHAPGNRLDACSSRTAPLQLHWPLEAIPAGHDNCDFTVLGEDLLTAGAEAFFPERLLALPGPQQRFIPPPGSLAPVDPPCLADGSIRFGAFADIAAINSDCVSLWAGALAAVAGSRLMLESPAFADPRVGEQLHRRFASEGIEAQRIELRTARSDQDPFERYARIDIALDPWPASDAAAAIDALWMGVPTLTLYGLRPSTRHVLAVLRAVGLEDFASHSAGDFARNAARLAADHAALAELRHGLRKRIISSSLSDGDSLARSLIELLRRNRMPLLGELLEDNDRLQSALLAAIDSRPPAPLAELRCQVITLRDSLPHAPVRIACDDVLAAADVETDRRPVTAVRVHIDARLSAPELGDAERAGLLMRRQLLRRSGVGQAAIPRQIHLIRSDDRNTDLPLLQFLCYRSMIDHCPGYQIVLHSPTRPQGARWASLLPHLELDLALPPQTLGRYRLQCAAHQSDVWRLQQLIEHGGFYFDWDLLLLRPPEALRDNLCVLALEEKVANHHEVLGVSAIGARRDSEFLRCWLEQMARVYRPEHYIGHSTLLARALALRLPGLLRLLPWRDFYYPGWTAPAMQWLFDPALCLSDEALAAHLGAVHGIHLFCSHHNFLRWAGELDEAALRRPRCNLAKLLGAHLTG